MKRRTLIGALLATGLPRSAWGFGDDSRIDIAELDLGSGTVAAPSAWSALLREVDRTTSLPVSQMSRRLSPSDPMLFEQPFVVCVGDAAFGMPTAESLARVRAYLDAGGFLLFDDVTGASDSGFDRSVRALARRLYPTRSLADLPTSHSIYRSFFLIDRPVGRIARWPMLEGVSVGDLTPLVYSRNHVAGALEVMSSGEPQHACVPRGEAQRSEAVQLAINLVMYSVTANYKRDQEHVRRLLLEGRL